MVHPHSDQLSSAEFSVLYDVCRRTTDLAVRDKITETWFEDVSSGILDPGNALNAAATDNNHPFLAQLYRLYLSQHTPLRTDMSTPVNFPVEGIASIHVQRMFAGHWSLSIYWNQLRKDMIPLPNAVGCSFIDHQTYCLPLYKAKWKEAASEAQDCYPLTEIPERLRHMRQRLLKAKSLTVCPSETGRWRCIEAVRGSNNKFSTLIQECESCVAKHFFVSEPAEPVST
ncbi:hypothetical protein C8R43DRAFT_1115931 [Mycena crocata]|nr:hypothetical protein C8R43DRAFT_1115931 [Mycena crocata]